MKIAVISDIHGNVAALDAVLADATTRQVDQIVNLGDICSGGLFPRETADRLMPLGLPTIRGNHERQLTDHPHDRMGLSDCGHTHLQRVMTLDDGRMIVNPGSVGLPAYDDDRPYAHLVESGSPHARYAVLSNDGEGWSTDLIAVEYDWEQAARDAEANSRADWPGRCGRAACS